MQSIAQMPVLAFGHSSRVGKDTCMRAIVEHVEQELAKGRMFPFTQVQHESLSSALKNAGTLLFGVYGFKDWAYYETQEGAPLRDQKLPGVGLTPTEICVELGDKLRQIHARVFVDNALSALRADTLTVFTSLRFTSEGLALQAHGGWVIKVVRPDAPPPLRLDNRMDPHFPWNRVLVNDGTVEQLRQKAIDVFEDYLRWLSR